VESWRDLKVWRKAHSLVLQVYKLVDSFPSGEKFRLADQLCRSATSVAANIVEGYARHTTKEYLQFLYQARGSIEETRYHLLLAKDLGYLELADYAELEQGYEEMSRMLNSLIQSLRTKVTPRRQK